MPITTDNRPVPLFAHNQMLNAEARQVPVPDNRTERRYFLWPKGRVQDAALFLYPYDGLWFANEERTLVIQRLPNREAILVGEL